MYVLGINAAFHDSSACLLKDGNLVAAAEEERFTRIKHGKRPVPFSTYELPYHAIHYCLREAGIHINDVAHTAYSFDPYLLLNQHALKPTISLPLEPSLHPHEKEWMSVWDPLFLSSIVNAPRQLLSGYPHHLQQVFSGGRLSQGKWHFVEHHICHAASAFHASPFRKAAILTIDGRGEKVTTSYHLGEENDLVRIGHVDMPHSLGLLYESVTEYLGFLRSSDEYKVMALASFGKPVYSDYFHRLIRLLPEGRFTVKEPRLEERFGPARRREEPLRQLHFDIAHSLQKVLEDTVLEISDWLYRNTGEQNLCLAGGVALNCVLNGVIRQKSAFRNIWVQPAAGDAGTALGAALWIDARHRKGSRKFRMDHAYWGPSYKDEEVENYLKWTKTPYKRLKNVARETAALLAEDKIVAWYQGRMEFGPRALGGRSILASPLKASMQARLNDIKGREDFRPVAPVVPEEKASEWFEDASVSPFMLFVYNVRPQKLKKIPAVCHVDRTARIQTVNREQHPLYYDLLQAFGELTGVPVLINTSFNTRSEPIVCSPQDALGCFWTSPFDALVINSFLVTKAPLQGSARLAHKMAERDK